jgi:hypothetical protein
LHKYLSYCGIVVVEYHADQNAIISQGVAARSNQALAARKRSFAFGISTASRAPRNIISYNDIPAAVIKPGSSGSMPNTVCEPDSGGSYEADEDFVGFIDR